jgi:RNA polymerase sigma-70 factor (ECF subfamily)
MVLRKDLCLEAMRLCYLLTTREGLVRSDVYSLLALMCFQASRFDARFDATGGLVVYEQQDPARWDDELIGRGNYFLVKGCEGGLPSRYHFEAAIAWWHTHPADESEKWTNILKLYNQLLILQYSPVAALNRAYAFSRVYGKGAAIPEAEGLKLEGNLFYHSLLGELYTGVDEVHAAAHLEQALGLAGTDAEKAILRGKLNELTRPPLSP